MLGPLLLLLGAWGYKALSLASQIGGDDPALGFVFLVNDLPIVGTVLLLTTLACLLPSRLLRAILRGGAFAVLLLFLADCFTTFALDVRLSLREATKYSEHADYLTDHIDWKVMGVLASLLLLPFLRVRIRTRTAWWLGLLSVALLSIGWAHPLSFPDDLADIAQKYVPSAIERNLAARSAPHLEVLYTETEVALYGASRWASDFEAPTGHPNLIVLMVESLSAVDSLRTSGLRDHLPRLDEISRDGILFRNFFANHEDSEGGESAVLSGIPPVAYPGSSRGSIYASMSYIDTPVWRLRRAGYYTEYLTTYRLRWLDHVSYLERVGFEARNGRENVAAFQKAPGIHFKGTPPDEYLYEEALDTVAGLLASPRPFFLTLFPASNHLPYRDPKGRGDTEANVLDYVDEEIRVFYDGLVARGFFENGVLIVLGDHRKMTPVTAEETQRYGASAVARTPLVVIGRGIPRGRIDDRFFQQSDLLARLDDLANPAAELSRIPMLVERKARLERTANGWRKIDPNFLLFFPAEAGTPTAHRATIESGRIVWLGAQLVDPRMKEAEQMLHYYRSALQAAKTRTRGDCNIPLASLDPLPARGLDRRIYRGSDVQGNLSPERLISAGTTREIDFAGASELVGVGSAPFAAQYRGFLEIPASGEYQFRIQSNDGVCLAIGGEMVVDENRVKDYLPVESVVYLEEGLLPLELRYFRKTGEARLEVRWKPPGARIWAEIPSNMLHRGSAGGAGSIVSRVGQG